MNALIRNCLVVLIFASSWVWTWVDAAVQAIWPSVVALTVVVITRKALVGLMTGAAAGALILADGHVWNAYIGLCSEHFAPHFSSSWKLGAVAFTLLMGGFAAVLEKGGGFSRILEWFLRRGRDPSKGLQLGVMGLGVACFFDGLANSLLVGRISQKLGARCGVSKLKLAYLVDSTSSAVACLAFVSTWIAYQLSMIQEGFKMVGQEVNPYVYFVHSIPLNFYCWFTLVLCIVCIVKKFDPGMMGREEALARKQISQLDAQQVSMQAVHGGGWWSVLIPLLVLLAGMLLAFYWIGLRDAVQAGRLHGYLPLSGAKIVAAFGTREGPYILSLMGVVGGVVAMVFYPHGKAAAPVLTVYADGMRAMLMPLLILIGAWMLSSTLGALRAGDFIAGWMTDAVPLWSLPVLIFCMGALMSFTTGTSWGTMGILMPLAIPLMAKHPDFGAMDATMPLFGAAVGAVFSGAVFGDHCSPISDTTIVSSIACGVEPHDHVRSQMPFALMAALLAALVGFIPAGLGVTPWLSLLLGTVLLFGVGQLALHLRKA